MHVIIRIGLQFFHDKTELIGGVPEGGSFDQIQSQSQKSTVISPIVPLHLVPALHQTPGSDEHLGDLEVATTDRDLILFIVYFFIKFMISTQ